MLSHSPLLLARREQRAWILCLHYRLWTRVWGHPESHAYDYRQHHETSGHRGNKTGNVLWRLVYRIAHWPINWRSDSIGQRG